MAATQKTEESNEWDQLDLDNSIVLNPMEIPVKGKDIELKVSMLSNFIKQEHLFTPFKKEPELDDMALTNILTNLLIADEKGKWLAYHREISQYSMYNKNYGFPYYNHNGFIYKESGKGRTARMKLTDKLKAVLSRNHMDFETMQLDYFCVNEIGEVRYTADNSLLRTTSKLPLVAVILKDKEKKPINYSLTTRVVQMIRQVDRYNKFISKALVVLPVETSDLMSKNIDPAISVQVDDLSNAGQKYTLIPQSSKQDMVRFLRNVLVFGNEATVFNRPTEVPLKV
jgi:hypothetical protein